MTSEIVKSEIADSFSKAANTYDNFADIQREVAAEVFFRVKEQIKPGQKILDLGCGTGYLAKIINAEMIINSETPNPVEITQVDISPKMTEKAASIKNTKTIIADMEKLPLPYDEYDVVLSSLAAQWSNLTKVLREVRRVKKAGCPYVLSTLGSKSFQEIKADFPEIKFKNMLNISEIKYEAEKAKIPNLLVKPQVIKQEYNNLLEFFHTLKNIGATVNEGGSYLGKDLVKRLKETKNYSVSWEIVYLQNFN